MDGRSNNVSSLAPGGDSEAGQSASRVRGVAVRLAMIPRALYYGGPMAPAGRTGRESPRLS